MVVVESMVETSVVLAADCVGEGGVCVGCGGDVVDGGGEVFARGC